MNKSLPARNLFLTNKLSLFRWITVQLALYLLIGATAYNAHGQQLTRYRTQFNNTVHLIEVKNGEVIEQWATIDANNNISGRGTENLIHVTKSQRPRGGSMPAAYGCEWTRTQHIFYIGENGNMYELWWDEGTGWYAENLSRALKIPAPLYLSGYSFENNQSKHVFYVGEHGRIYELWWNTTTGWHFEDLTPVLKAPRANGKLSCYLLNNTQHVVYRGTDRDIS